MPVFIEPVELVPDMLPDADPDAVPPKVVLPEVEDDGDVLLVVDEGEVLLVAEEGDVLVVEPNELSCVELWPVAVPVDCDWFVDCVLALMSVLEVVPVVDVPYAVPDVVVGTVVAVVVVDTPVSGSVEDRVVWLQPLRINPRSAAMKAVFFIGGLSCAATDRAHMHRFADPTGPSRDRAKFLHGNRVRGRTPVAFWIPTVQSAVAYGKFPYTARKESARWPPTGFRARP